MAETPPRWLQALVARIVRREVRRTMTAVRFRTGTAETATDEEGDTMVVLDGAPALVGSDAEATADAEIDTLDPNPAVPCVTVCGYVAPEERVLCASVPDGATYVVGSVDGGQPRALGLSYVAGGTADDTSHSASSANNAITALDTEAVVQHDRHIVSVSASVVVFATVGGSGGTADVYRVDEDDTTEVYVGRLFAEDVRAGPTGETITNTVIDLPDPGVWTYRVKISVSSGFTLRYDFTPDPLFAAFMLVRDEGPLLGGAWPAS